MAVLWIIGGILLLLILLLLLRVGVHLRFGEQLELTVIAGPARIQLLPRPEKTETEQKTKQKKKAKGEAQEEKKPAKQREKLSLSFEDVRSALPYLWEGLKRALARTRRRMRIDPLRLSVVFAGEDPAAVAQTYGWASSAMWTLMPQLERLLKIPDPHIHLGTDFGAARTQIEGEAGILPHRRPAHHRLGFRYPAAEMAAETEKGNRTICESGSAAGTGADRIIKKGSYTMENNEKKNHSLIDLMDASMSKIREMVDSNTIIGEPIQTPDGVTLIPVSRLSFGFGCGGGDYGKQTPAMFGGASTAGVKVEPVAFLVVKDGVTRVLPVGVPAVTTAARMVEMVPEVMDRVEHFIDKRKEEKESF